MTDMTMIFKETFLEEILAWVENVYMPEDVFSFKVLLAWAQDVAERAEIGPEDIFSVEDLTTWADDYYGH